MEKAMPAAKGLFLTPTMDGHVLEDGYYALMDAGRIKDIPYMLGTTKDDILVTPEMVEKGEFSELYQGCIAFSEKLEELGRKRPGTERADAGLLGELYEDRRSQRHRGADLETVYKRNTGDF